MQEVWMPVVGYEGLYEVSNLGNVKSLPKTWKISRGHLVTTKEKILKLSKMNIGYYSVGIDRKTMYVHHLVFKAFTGLSPIRYKYVIDHIDNNPLNNNLDNLQLITQKENLTKDKKSNKQINK